MKGELARVGAGALLAVSCVGCYSAPDESLHGGDVPLNDGSRGDTVRSDDVSSENDTGPGAEGSAGDSGNDPDAAGGDVSEFDGGAVPDSGPDGSGAEVEPDVGLADVGGVADAQTDAGSPEDAASDAGAGGDEIADAGAGPGEEVLLKVDGPFFTPDDADPMRRYDVGQNGTVYNGLDLSFDFVAADYVPQPAGGNRLEHILFGLFRAHRPSSNERYIAGAAAVTFADGKAPHFRMFGRVTIGSGYQTYTSDSGTYRWASGGNYRMECHLDGLADVQECILLLAGQKVATRTLSVGWLVPDEHLSTGFWIEIGTDVINEISATPIGWQFSNLLVSAIRK